MADSSKSGDSKKDSSSGKKSSKKESWTVWILGGLLALGAVVVNENPPEAEHTSQQVDFPPIEMLTPGGDAGDVCSATDSAENCHEVAHVQFLVQQHLGDTTPAGFSVDGVFGPVTEQAVRQFQQREGLRPDGVVGPETQAALGMCLPQGSPIIQRTPLCPRS